MRWKLVGFGALLVAGVMVLASQQVSTQPACCDARVDTALPEWSAGLHTMNEAIAAGDARQASRAWRDAWILARRSRRWDAMIAAGDGALRIGELSGLRSSARADARTAYQAALFRAYGDGSAEGVLRTGEAMAVMGDRELTEVALHFARRLAARAPGAEARAAIEQGIQRLTDRTQTAVSASPQIEENDPSALVMWR